MSLGGSRNARADGNSYLRSLGHLFALGIALLDNCSLGLVAVFFVYFLIELEVERFEYGLRVLGILIYELGNLDELLLARIIDGYRRAL